MIDLSLLLQTLGVIFQPENIVLIFGGMFVGLFFGALPGISSSMGIVLMLPFTYSMGIIPSIVMLVALYAGSAYGGSITAVLFNTPGTPEAVATTFDGYPMAQQGKAGRALGLAVSASSIGGTISVIVMVLSAPILSSIALKIQSAEYFALTFLGLTCIAGIGGSGTPIKALISGCIGVLLAMVGMDPMTGSTRFTFDQLELLTGIEFIPVMIGAFALSEVLKMASENSSKKMLDTDNKISLETINLKELLKQKVTLVKSSLIGTLVGILPGTGGSIASVLSYGEELRSSKTPELMGKGCDAGIIAPEAANNAAAGGAMIPTLVLGIPGSPTTAIILAALVLQGLQPGPRLMHEQPLMLYAIFFSMLIASITILFTGRVAVKAFAYVLRFPYHFIGSAIVVLSIIGSYAIANSVFGIWIMIAFGILGFFMKRYKYSPPALVLGMVLGKLMEENFRRHLLLSDGNYLSFFSRPLAIIIMIFALGTLFWPLINKILKSRKNTGKLAGEV